MQRWWLAILLGCVASAQALTNEQATILWPPTTEATIRYELRWRHFGGDGQWQSVASDVDSTLGKYVHTYPAFPDSTADRTVCWDVRAVFQGVPSPWLSEHALAVCHQMPQTVVFPPPLLPGLQVVSATPLQVVVVAKPADCPRLSTSTRGTTALMLKRTVTCVK